MSSNDGMNFYEYEELLEQENKERDDALQHWGILGMKWGVRRFQNPDGSLTTAGRERYGKSEGNKVKSGVINNTNTTIVVNKTTNARSDNTPTKESKANQAQVTPRKRSYKELSDKELREVNERTRLENEFLRQTYEKMKLEQGPQIQKGDSWLRKAANLTGDIRNLLSNLDQIANIFGFDVSKYITNRGPKEELDLSKMSDDELQKFLKRLSNESAVKKLLGAK